LNPDKDNLPKFDPKDDFLLADPSSSTGAYPINGSQSGSINGHPTPLAHVPWLRKTEYIGREGFQKAGVHEP
jgi:RNA polymerase II-associated factor 1